MCLQDSIFDREIIRTEPNNLLYHNCVLLARLPEQAANCWEFSHFYFVSWTFLSLHPTFRIESFPDQESFHSRGEAWTQCALGHSYIFGSFVQVPMATAASLLYFALHIIEKKLPQRVESPQKEAPDTVICYAIPLPVLFLYKEQTFWSAFCSGHMAFAFAYSMG